MSETYKTIQEQYLARALRDFNAAKQLVYTADCSGEYSDLVGVALILAARLEALEDAITHGLPTAGEGI